MNNTRSRSAAQVIVFILAAIFVSTLWAAPSWGLDVNVETSKGRVLSSLNVYAFSESGSYTGLNASTDGNGTAVFDAADFADGNYKFRADYLGSQFWSPVITMPGATSVDVVIEEETTEVTTTTAAGPAQGIRVYLFSGTGSYLGLYDDTDADGKVFFDLPVGKEFKFRADIMSSQYWSDVVTIQTGDPNQVLVDAGGGILQVTVEKSAGNPMEGINTYLFTASGTYLGLSQVTDSSGIVEYSVTGGGYKVRADYLGYQFWSQDTTVTENTSITLPIPHQDVVITVQGTYQSTPDPMEGITVYLFTASGSYMGQNQVTSTGGQVTFNLPEPAYKVRADYLGQQFWSSDFQWQDTTVNIPMADAEITVTGSSQPLEGVNVYVFTGAGSYLGINGTTNGDGNKTFRLPAGPYKFRADYQGSQYWSGEETLVADQVNPVTISTGGGTFTLTVLKGSADPLVGVNCYVFSEAGSYLGMSATTDSNGQVSFVLADGTYKIRVDYLGYQFWTQAYDVPTTLSDDFLIAHQDVVITVEGMYLTAEAMEGITVYLFTASGSYMGQNQMTDPSGQVIFNLPEQLYKVRADYLSQQFWSGEFTWQNTTVLIPQGLAQVHVFRFGADVEGASVYLFTGAGSYLGWNETTDSTGMAEFIIPEGSYKFRADEGGDQRWSDVIAITAGQVTNVELSMGDLPPTVTISADPETIQSGASSTLTWSSTNADSVSIDQGIGSVALSGTTTVSPTVTTTYTITATGPGGTAQDSVEVQVLTSQADLDYGLNTDEQQGGGGLVGETIRILNGNTIEYRSDLQFQSPNRLGLSLVATYNSRSDLIGAMGHGWRHTYEVSLDPAFDLGGITLLKIIDSTGRASYFLEETPGEYSGVFAERTNVTLEVGEYIWYQLDGSQYIFNASGQLTRIEDSVGNQLLLTYDSNSRIETVTDTSSGRVLTFTYNANNLLDHVTGPITSVISDGIWVTYGYDANQNLTSVTYPDGSGFNYFYTDANDPNNLTEKENKAGHLINTWGYDIQDRATDNFSRDGKGVSINYESDTQINVTDAYGKVREYFLDIVSGRKRVITIINGPGGAGGFPYSNSNAVSWIYDEYMRPTEVEYAGGAITQYLNYDQRSNPGIIKLAFGTFEERVINYTYHPDMDAPLTRIEPSVLGGGNKETIWDYDNDYDSIPNEDPTSLISRIIERGFTKDATGNVIPYEYITTFTYNTKGQVLSIDGPKPGPNDTTSFAYDPATGDLLSITRPIIGSTGFSGYDAAGQVGLVTDVNFQSKSFIYDARGRVILITNNADGSSSSVVYNTAGLPESRMDEDGIESSYEYDLVYGRMSKRIDHEGNYIAYSYDDQGNVIEQGYYDPSQVRTNRKRFLYQDPAHNMPGLLFREINGDGTYTQYGYDLEGNVASVKDPNNNTTSYEYDPLNRLITVTQPGTVVTSYTYDGHGNLQTVTDAEGHITTYEYDDMGRLVSTTSPDTGTVTYVYDEAGNPIGKKDAKGINVGYLYDTLNRLTNVNFPDDSQDITYSYDSIPNGKGRRTGMIDQSGSMTFGYDDRGRLIGKTSIINGITYNISRSYTLGSRISSITYPTGRTIDYDRTSCTCKVDAISTTHNSNTVTLMENLSYRPFGRVKGMDTRSGDTVGSQFDDNGRMTVSNPGAEHERTYTYDNNGNLTSVNAPSTPWQNRVFGYDALNRLDHAEGPWGSIDYTYDDVGNRLTKVVNGVTDAYTYYPGTNRLNEVGTVTYTFDLNGNITGIGNKILTYNQNNRLIKVDEDSVTLGEYTYNGLGQRILKTVGGITTVFHYDFDGNIIGESDLSGNFSKEYLYRGKGRLALVDVTTGEIYLYGNDRLGTPQILTDSTNTVVWEAIYKPFGEADVNPNSSVVNNFRFPGQYYDSETGFHYNYHRYYEPSTGRYLRADPIGQIVGINTYLYTGNNPINLTDKNGLFTEFSYAGIKAHKVFSTWIRGRYPSLVTDTPLYKKGLGLSGLRPDVIDIMGVQVWELKPYSHLENSKYWQSDYAQMSKYLCETGFRPGNSNALVPAPGTPIGSIEDLFGNIRDVYLYPGNNGFIYYKLGKAKANTYKETAKEIGRQLKKGLDPKKMTVPIFPGGPGIVPVIP